MTIKVPHEVYVLVEKSLEKARETVALHEKQVTEAQERLDATKRQVAELEVSLTEMSPSELTDSNVVIRGRGRPRKVA